MVLETNIEDKKNIKEFENLLKEDFKKRDLKEGGIAKAVVSEIGKKYVFVDLKAKSEGIIPIEEFKITKELETLKVGSKIDVVLETIESKDGQVIVSASKAKKINGYNAILKSYEK